uniref:Putative ovule protein n=1 Tax=Solanum chacoense TaxID=4108 RepID=A0A0V0I2H1_SOLCH
MEHYSILHLDSVKTKGMYHVLKTKSPQYNRSSLIAQVCLVWCKEKLVNETDSTVTLLGSLQDYIRVLFSFCLFVVLVFFSASYNNIFTFLKER